MTLILLPGMMCDERLFTPQTHVIKDARVITSIRSDTITGMAQDVLEKSPDKFSLAGLSLGGIVAMEVIRLAPTRVTKLALMDTNHKAELEMIKSLREPQIDAVKSGKLTDVMQNEMKPRYLVEGQRKGAILDLCMDMATDLGSEVFLNQSYALMSRRDQTDTLKRIAIPTLVLCGEQDQLCPVSRHQEMASLIPNANLEIIPNAGHLPTLEQPELTTTALMQWLEAS